MNPTIRLLRRYELPDNDFDTRRACQKREFLYFLPYNLLNKIWTPQKQQLLLANNWKTPNRLGAKASGSSGDGDKAFLTWVCDLPDSCSAEDLCAFANSRLVETQTVANCKFH